jgi:hypothetical protein
MLCAWFVSAVFVRSLIASRFGVLSSRRSTAETRNAASRGTASGRSECGATERRDPNLVALVRLARHERLFKIGDVRLKDVDGH